MLGRIEHKDVETCYREDTVGRVYSNNRTKDFVPYVNKKRKEKIPVYPCICYNLKEKLQ